MAMAMFLSSFWQGKYNTWFLSIDTEIWKLKDQEILLLTRQYAKDMPIND